VALGGNVRGRGAERRRARNTAGAVLRVKNIRPSARPGRAARASRCPSKGPDPSNDRITRIAAAHGARPPWPQSQPVGCAEERTASFGDNAVRHPQDAESATASAMSLRAPRRSSSCSGSVSSMSGCAGTDSVDLGPRVSTVIDCEPGSGCVAPEGGSSMTRCASTSSAKISVSVAMQKRGKPWPIWTAGDWSMVTKCLLGSTVGVRTTSLSRQVEAPAVHIQCDAGPAALARFHRRARSSCCPTRRQAPRAHHPPAA
jgi:hypothetical protein